MSLSEAEEQKIMDNIIKQFVPISVSNKEPDIEQPEIELDNKLNYNDYYINQGINYIKRNDKLNDPLMDLVFELEAEKITTPLNDWKKRNFNNNYFAYDV
jgi:hypothetical protein